ncbi:hypothetical protein BGY98DRAFT_1175996 [Russula aff. rugulosa BPL654]|nr:hypothetical protein BGY98DRAFT_1175996 [Russula aff. rugulosa BPL654]
MLSQKKKKKHIMVMIAVDESGHGPGDSRGLAGLITVSATALLVYDGDGGPKPESRLGVTVSGTWHRHIIWTCDTGWRSFSHWHIFSVVIVPVQLGARDVILPVALPLRALHTTDPDVLRMPATPAFPDTHPPKLPIALDQTYALLSARFCCARLAVGDKSFTMTWIMDLQKRAVISISVTVRAGDLTGVDPAPSTAPLAAQEQGTVIASVISIMLGLAVIITIVKLISNAMRSINTRETLDSMKSISVARKADHRDGRPGTLRDSQRYSAVPRTERGARAFPVESCPSRLTYFDEERVARYDGPKYVEVRTASQFLLRKRWSNKCQCGEYSRPYAAVFFGWFVSGFSVGVVKGTGSLDTAFSANNL